MDELYKKKCIACDGNTVPFDTSEIHKYLKKIDNWDVKSNDENKYYLEKSFTFKNFIESQIFVNKVSSTAETEGHHPDICFGWGYVKIKIFTHAIKGLAESDFILAAKIDHL
ncbi:4a-hydroxytetrahydrobiopterin dehydratase [Pelagibacteraceae bacterium]|nr:4a-hydroxytetrahydrobiopterin dehydratase [Pelagibacteraceae bacterium]